MLTESGWREVFVRGSLSHWLTAGDHQHRREPALCPSSVDEGGRVEGGQEYDPSRLRRCSYCAYAVWRSPVLESQRHFLPQFPRWL